MLTLECILIGYQYKTTDRYNQRIRLFRIQVRIQFRIIRNRLSAWSPFQLCSFWMVCVQRTPFLSPQRPIAAFVLDNLDVAPQVNEHRKSDVVRLRCLCTLGSRSKGEGTKPNPEVLTSVDARQYDWVELTCHAIVGTSRHTPWCHRKGKKGKAQAKLEYFDNGACHIVVWGSQYESDNAFSTPPRRRPFQHTDSKIQGNFG